MLIENIKKSSGQVTKTLLALAILVLVGLAIAYIVVTYTKPKPKEEEVPVSELPTYETTMGEVRYVFLEATDMGDVLRVSDIKDKTYYYGDDITTTERFITVTVGGQNVGKENTKQGVWGAGDIVDEEGRSYTALEDNVSAWLKQGGLCGSILKPSFEPTPCERIYEVAKVAKKLKIKVILYDNAAYNQKVIQEGIIDIKLMP